MKQPDEVVFVDEDADPVTAKSKPDWKILIVDDEPEVHDVTRLSLRSLTYESRGLTFLSAHSGREARRILAEHPDIALVLLDVVMEEEDAGLKFVTHIREEVKNHLVRIVLRTGQPGEAPEERVVHQYGINDYKSKAELTAQRLSTCVVTALRTYQHLTVIEDRRGELQRTVQAYERFDFSRTLRLLEKHVAELHPGDRIERNMSVAIHELIVPPSRPSLGEQFELVDRFLKRIEPVVREHRGLLDRLFGDRVVCLYPERADDAVAASLEILGLGVPMGIGIASGPLIFGAAGSEEHLVATIVADVVPAAARLVSEAVSGGDALLISEGTLRALADPSAFDRSIHRTLLFDGGARSVTAYGIARD
jgi:two-component system sensor histidine kinase ChiS